MNTLAKLTFEYLWLLNFADEDVIDLDYSVKLLEGVQEYFSAMSVEEKAALSQVAAETRARLLAEPDEDGYTPRKLVTEEQKIFLDALSVGDFEHWA